jgi:hypothetical protein
MRLEIDISVDGESRPPTSYNRIIYWGWEPKDFEKEELTVIYIFDRIPAGKQNFTLKASNVMFDNFDDPDNILIFNDAMVTIAHN